MGAYFMDDTYQDEGKAFVYLGDERGLPDRESGVLDSPNPQQWAHFGVSAAVAGDLDGDGDADFAVGAYEQNGSGAVYVYEGSTSGLTLIPTTELLNPAANEDFWFGFSLAGAMH